MPSCGAIDYQNRSGIGIKFHRLPNKKNKLELRKKWLDKIREKFQYHRMKTFIFMMSTSTKVVIRDNSRQAAPSSVPPQPTAQPTSQSTTQAKPQPVGKPKEDETICKSSPPRQDTPPSQDTPPPLVNEEQTTVVKEAAEEEKEEEPETKPTHQDDISVDFISYDEACRLRPQNVNDMWSIVKKTSDREPINVEPLRNRKGWRTIRIFVSSTFKDFHQEREVLVKEVFPDLRLWCEQRKLRLVECDLRWGVPKDSTTEETIKICLSELDRCYEDNVAPFFLNLSGERSGWIPSFGDISVNVASQYGWVYGLSVTEMEIVHGAFRKFNPNALFLLREPDSLIAIPEEKRADFQDTDEMNIEKLKTLKSIISDTFQESCVVKYTAEAQQDGTFKGLGGESPFTENVYNFFQKRIEELYPLDPSKEDPLQVQREAHETFLDSRSQCVLGRDKLINQITTYISGENKENTPLLVIGFAGAGKSALMAKCASEAVRMVQNNEIEYARGQKCRVFFHFVGATPGSTDLAFFLQRLTKELKPDMKDIVSDLETLIQLTTSLLSNPNTEPTLVFIDAVNQLDEDKQQFLSRWLPDQLSSNVRVVVSMIEGTPSHQMLRAYKPSPREVVCGPLDTNSRKEIVCNILAMYNKRLDEQQLDTLVHKDGSSNPLWLTMACEELRVFGRFDLLIEKIKGLPDDLISLEMEVFSRFESESGGVLMKATLCLLEVSRHGLLETELLALLGNKNNTQVPEYVEDESNMLSESTETHRNNNVTVGTEQKTDVELLADKMSQLKSDTYKVQDEKEGEKKENRSKNRKRVEYLAAREWAIIYRNLKPLLRPCGDLGEGRLDFYHRSLSKAVRKKYFEGSKELVQHTYNYWHGVLAGYFEEVDDMDRKAEELPYHLEQLLDNNRLIRCLLEWPVFDRLYSEDFSVDLLRSWQKAGGYAVASAMYKESLNVFKDNTELVTFGDQMEKVAVFLIQAGQYTEASSILEERVQIEHTQLGSRPDELADVYQMIAKCKSEVVKNHNFVTPTQLQEDIEVVEICRKSQHYREMLEQTEEQKFKMALNNILMCHHLAIIADLKGDDTYRRDAATVIDQAIEIFKEQNDIGHLSEAIMTKSFVNKRLHQYFVEKEKQLMLSMELCMKAYGENHMLYVRLCLNIGILYEDDGDYQKAFEYFLKWDKATTEVLGPNHPKTIRAKQTLEEPIYKRMRDQKKRQAAGTA